MSPKFPACKGSDALPSGSSSPQSEFWAGCRDVVPLVIGAIPFGLIFGAIAPTNGLSFTGAITMSAFVFAGSAQFIALGLLASGTGWLLIVLTTLVVNLRHLLYAVTLVPHIKHLSQRWKLTLGFWLTDEAFAIAIQRYTAPDTSPHKHWYYLGAALFMYLNWQLCTGLGFTVGRLIPNAAHWGLDFAMSVTFIGMIIPYLTHRPMIITVLVAGSVALLTYQMPHKLGLIVAAIAGVVAGMTSETRQM